jgi:hypothetical protein
MRLFLGRLLAGRRLVAATSAGHESPEQSDLVAVAQSLGAASQELFRKRPTPPTKQLLGKKAQQRLVSAPSGLPNRIRKGSRRSIH